MDEWIHNMALGKSLKARTSPFQVWRRRLLLTFVVVTAVIGICVYAAPPGFQAYPLQHSSPEDVVVQLRKQLLDLVSDAKVYADTQSNQVLVQGSEATQQL